MLLVKSSFYSISLIYYIFSVTFTLFSYWLFVLDNFIIKSSFFDSCFKLAAVYLLFNKGDVFRPNFFPVGSPSLTLKDYYFIIFDFFLLKYSNFLSAGLYIQTYFSSKYLWIFTSEGLVSSIQIS